MTGDDFLWYLMLAQQVKLRQEGLKDLLRGLIQSNLRVITATPQHSRLSDKQHLHTGVAMLSEYRQQIQIAPAALNVLCGLNVL